MKTKIFNAEGHGKEMELPEFFSKHVREDIVAKVLEASKSMQPYAPSLVAGKQHSASGIIRHARRKWRTAYGKGIARVPRKILSGRGSQFNWVGAEIASTRGGRRAHPPKAASMINTLKINKKEMKLALISAISATANAKLVEKKYSRLENTDVKHLPVIVEDKVISLKTKDFLNLMKKILGEKLFEVSIKEKRVRAGKGKMRGRQYKKSAGLLVVTGNKEKIHTKVFDVKKAGNLSVTDLANGGLGRLVVYTEDAIKDLKTKLENDKSEVKSK